MKIGNTITIQGVHVYVVEDIKCGGMGEVYKLKNRSVSSDYALTFKEVVAVKTYRDNMFNRQYKDVFEKELNRWIALDHSHIAPLQLIFTKNGRLMALMPWFDLNLSEYLHMITAPFSDIKKLATSIATALDYANKTFGLLHRDIKPENILLSIHKNGDVQYFVSDWGISGINNEDYLIEVDTHAKHLMAGVGTPGYMSPERIIGEENGISGDIFSIGMVIYKSLFKTLPYESRDAGGINSEVIKGTYFELIKNNTNKINSKLAAVIIRCLTPNSVDRYLNYKSFISDISNL